MNAHCIGSCWLSETDTDYQNFIFVYKDNVETADLCCEFCNSNSRCRVWSLQTEVKRCYLKFDRGARVYNRGFISGFSYTCKLFISHKDIFGIKYHFFKKYFFGRNI